MWILLGEYIILAATCAIEHRFILSFYWFAAAMLNLSVIFMNK